MEEEEPFFLKYVSRRIYRQESMSQRIDQLGTFYFDCIYMYHYTVKLYSHTICPQCPDSEKRQNRRRMMVEKNYIREQLKLESASRKQLSPVQLILEYVCRNIAPRIDECIQDITDLNKRKRVQKILWKNWFLFIEPVETKEVEKILRRQRTRPTTSTYTRKFMY